MEFVIVVPLLILFFLGIIEFGTLLNDRMVLTQGARQGARQAALGKNLATIRDSVRLASFGDIADSSMSIRYYDTATGQWLTVTDSQDGAQNAAPTGSLLSVRVENHPRRMVTGSFFFWLPGYSNGNFLLAAERMMRRE